MRDKLSFRPCLCLTFLFKMTRQRQSTSILSCFPSSSSSFFSLPRSLSFLLLCIYSSQASYVDAFSCTYKKKAREREEKRSRGKRGRRNSYIVVVVVAVVSPSFLISRVNFHCMQQKNEEEEKLQQRR